MNAMTMVVPYPRDVAVSVKSAIPNLKDLILVRGTVNGTVVIAPDTDNPLLRDAVRLQDQGRRLATPSKRDGTCTRRQRTLL